MMKAKLQLKKKPDTKAPEAPYANGTGPATANIAPATVTATEKESESIYEDGVKEIVTLSENDTYARKLDNGPLSESRGKDTWRLHAQLRAIDRLNQNVARQAHALRTSLATIDEHLNQDAAATTNLVQAQTGALRTDMQRVVNQSDELGKSVEQQLADFKDRIERHIHDLRDETSRLIEKRFNQVDISFAVVRADLEVVKALVTDIIKDRLGRTDVRGR